MKVQWDITLTGRVQAVGMRFMVRNKAHEMGLTGTVRNIGTNSVKIRIVGTEAFLKDFKTWLLSNPGSSRIEHLSIAVSEPDKVDDFSISY